ncbi:hypothetical protein EMIT0324P_20615 [Pseudomonas chlororaphis]
MPAAGQRKPAPVVRDFLRRILGRPPASPRAGDPRRTEDRGGRPPLPERGGEDPHPPFPQGAGLKGCLSSAVFEAEAAFRGLFLWHHSCECPCRHEHGEGWREYLVIGTVLLDMVSVFRLAAMGLTLSPWGDRMPA